MYRKGSILLPVLFVLFIFSLLAIAGVFYLYQKEHAQNIKFQGQIAELENLQRNTTGKLDESKKVATDLTLKLQEAKNKIDSLSEELAAEKSTTAEISNKLEQFKVDLSKQKSLREDLENQLSQVQVDAKKNKEAMKIMQQQKVALEEKIKDLEIGADGVELGRVIVSPELPTQVDEAALAKSKMSGKNSSVPDAKVLKGIKAEQPRLLNQLEGKVMVVNKEFNFVVINLGSRDKVKVDDEFLVSRAGTPIGDIKIEKVHEAMAAAGFVVELRDLIKENDIVTQKIK